MLAASAPPNKPPRRTSQDRCALALAVLRHRFDLTHPDVACLERVLLGLDIDSLAAMEARR